MGKMIIDQEYKKLFLELKKRVTASRYRASVKVNNELINLYHHIGNIILQSQEKEGWGAKIINQLSIDLKAEFPEMKGFSPQNLKYMRKFAEKFNQIEIGQQAVDRVPWGHIVLLIYSGLNKEQINFYVNQTVENGWSRNVLSIQIETKLHKRKGAAVTNFDKKLPLHQSGLAQSTLKDPYIFDFLSVGDEAHEREVEKALVQHMEKFLLELGAGFAFVGRQYNLEVGGQDFYIDLLFYHLKLRCFIVIELKDKDFKPEYTGKMNFYLSAVDDFIKHETDTPSIGIILCKTKNNILAEYALRDMTKPIGIAEYRLEDSLPDDIKTSLPTIEELESELSKRINSDDSSDG